jgi:hypothetical protein
MWPKPACASTPGAAERILFSTDWTTGIDRRLQLQVSGPDSIRIVPFPAGDPRKVLRAQIARETDYTGVANGTPRAEISFGGFLHFIRGREYVVQWQMRIPDDYQFDSKQDEVIAQIHQGPAAGYPPFALFISGGGQYEVHSRTEHRQDYVTRLFGAPMFDRGNTVTWTLIYAPDPTGAASKTELFYNEQKVFSIEGVPNAYRGDDGAYFKLGIYKARWKRDPTDVDVRTIDFGPLVIKERIEADRSLHSSHGPKGRAPSDINVHEGNQ